MPIYEYQCDCGHSDDVLCRADQTPRVKCVCGKAMHRIFSAPAIRTDTTFMAGRNYDYLDRNPAAAKQALAKAKQQGMSTGRGNHYSAQLGQWFSSKADIRKECERRGWGCEGSDDSLKVCRAEANPGDGKYRVAEHIVEEHTQEAVDRDHGGHVSKKKRKQIKRELVTSLAGNQS